MEDNGLIETIKTLPVASAIPVVSARPVLLYIPGRIVDLQLRVSAPTTGRSLPFILLTYGQGISKHLSSLNDYISFIGFVVVQPTHLSSQSLSLDPIIPGAPLFWGSYVKDMKHMLGKLDKVEASVSKIKGRLDRSRVAVAGHSIGGHIATI